MFDGMKFSIGADTTGAVEAINKMAGSAESAGNKIEKEMSDASKKSTDAMEKFAAQAQKAMLVGIAGAAAALGKMFVDAFVTGEQALKRLELSLNAVGDSQAIERLSQLQKDFERFGIDDSVFNKAVAELTRSLEKGPTDAMLKTIADISAITGDSFDAIAGQFSTAMQEGGRLSKELADNLGLTKDQFEGWADMTKEQKEAILEAAAASGRFAGAAEEMANTVGGKIATLEGAIDNLKETIGQLLANLIVPILDALMPVFDVIMSILGRLTPLFETLGTLIARVLEIMQPIIDYVLANLTFNLELVSAWLMIIMQVLQALEPVINLIMDAFLFVANGLIDGMNAFIRLINKIPGVNIKEIANIGMPNSIPNSSGVGNKDISITIPVEIDGEKVAQVVTSIQATEFSLVCASR